jgi:hypothetical protein
VKAANIAGFMRQPNLDGALVGGASLDIAEVLQHRALPQPRRHLAIRALGDSDTSVPRPVILINGR